MREKVNAKIVKFKMRVPSTVSRNFLWEDKKNGSANVQVMFSNSHGCQEKESNAKNHWSDSPTKPPTVYSPTNFTKRTQVTGNSIVQADTSLGIFAYVQIRSKLKRWKTSNLFSGLSVFC